MQFARQAEYVKTRQPGTALMLERDRGHQSERIPSRRNRCTDCSPALLRRSVEFDPSLQRQRISRQIIAPQRETQAAACFPARTPSNSNGTRISKISPSATSTPLVLRLPLSAAYDASFLRSLAIGQRPLLHVRSVGIHLKPERVRRRFAGLRRLARLQVHHDAVVALGKLRRRNRDGRTPTPHPLLRTRRRAGTACRAWRWCAGRRCSWRRPSIRSSC